jgi:hypothetical protein
MWPRPIVGALEQAGVVFVEHEIHERRRLHQVDEVLLSARVGDDAAERGRDVGIHRPDGTHRPDGLGDVGVPDDEVAREASLDELLEHDVAAVQPDLRSRIDVVVDLCRERRMLRRDRIRGCPSQWREGHGHRRPADGHRSRRLRRRGNDEIDRNGRTGGEEAGCQEHHRTEHGESPSPTPHCRCGPPCHGSW